MDVKQHLNQPACLYLLKCRLVFPCTWADSCLCSVCSRLVSLLNCLLSLLHLQIRVFTPFAKLYLCSICRFVSLLHLQTRIFALFADCVFVQLFADISICRLVSLLHLQIRVFAPFANSCLLHSQTRVFVELFAAEGWLGG